MKCFKIPLTLLRPKINFDFNFTHRNVCLTTQTTCFLCANKLGLFIFQSENRHNLLRHILLQTPIENVIVLCRRNIITDTNAAVPFFRSLARQEHHDSFLTTFFPKKMIGFISRCNHTSSKFTLENPVYSSFLKSLVAEYKDFTKENNEYIADPEKRQRFLFLKLASGVIEELEKKYTEVQELQSMINGEEDKDMKILITKEIVKLKDEMQVKEQELIDILMGEDYADSKDIIMEISAGVGGQEAMLFCAELFIMYQNYAYSKGWTVTGLSNSESDIGGARKATIEISGESVYKHLKHEAGIHRVQRVPKTEKAGRIHTSTVTVSVLPQPSEIEIDIQPNDIKLETFRCGGPGGQHVNKTDSGVRITHLPTGIVSESRQDRSQIKNRELAMKNLKLKMYQSILEEEENKRKVTRKLQVGTKGRSEKIRTYNFQQDRITDHRSKEDYSNLSEFMLRAVGLDELIHSLNELEKLQVLELMLESYAADQDRSKATKG